MSKSLNSVKEYGFPGHNPRLFEVMGDQSPLHASASRSNPKPSPGFKVPNSIVREATVLPFENYRALTMTPRAASLQTSSIRTTIIPRASMIATPVSGTSSSVSSKKGGKSIKVVKAVGTKSKPSQLDSENPNYHDRAAGRRKALELDSEPQSFERSEEKKGLDFELFAQTKEKMKLASTAKAADSLPRSTPYEADWARVPIKSKFASRIVFLATTPFGEASVRTELFGPGRMAYIYHTGSNTSLAELPQVLVRSKAELRWAEEAALKNELDPHIYERIREIMKKQRTPVKVSSAVSNPMATLVNDDDDIFPDEGDYIFEPAGRDIHDAKPMPVLFEKPPSSSPSEHLLPKSLENIMSRSAPAKRKEDDSTEAGKMFPDPDSESALLDTYDECYPGTYQSVGIEYDSDEEDGQRPTNPTAQHPFNRKQAAIQKSRKQTHKLDSQLRQLSSMMDTKHGGPAGMDEAKKRMRK